MPKLARGHVLTPRLALSILAALALSATASLASASRASAAFAGGQLTASGYGEYGELGDGLTTEYVYRPVVSSLPAEVVQVAADYYSTLAVTAGGNVYGWGLNAKGEVGDGTKTEKATPQLIAGLSGVKQVAIGYYHSMALLDNGTVETWGSNEYDEIGDGTNGGEHLTPAPVPGLTGVKAIAAGGYFDLALLEDGEVKAWGYNGYGETGNGGSGEVSSPTTVPLPEPATYVSGAFYNAAAVLGSGAVMVWGYDEKGQLGNGEKTEAVRTPVKISLSGPAVSVGGGYEFGEALLASGTVETWGSNEYAELGDGNLEASTSPVAVPGLSGVTQLAAGAYFTLAKLGNGEVDGWGYADDGELGFHGEDVTTPSPTGFAPDAIGLAPGDGYNYSSFVIEGAAAKESASSLAFGSQPLGRPGAAQTVTLTNGGAVPLGVSGLSMSGSTAFTKTADSCTGTSLAVGASCQVSLEFSPKSAGGSSAMLAFVTSNSAVSTAPVALTGTGVPNVPPKISGLLLTSKSFAAAHSGPTATAAAAATGTYLLYSDSEAATTTFTVSASLPGIVSGKAHKCGKPGKHRTKHPKRCHYTKVLGSFKHTDVAGLNGLRFTGRVGGRTLANGSYTLVGTPTSIEGTGASVKGSFKIVR